MQAAVKGRVPEIMHRLDDEFVDTAARVIMCDVSGAFGISHAAAGHVGHIQNCVYQATGNEENDARRT